MLIEASSPTAMFSYIAHAFNFNAPKQSHERLCASVDSQQLFDRAKRCELTLTGDKMTSVSSEREGVSQPFQHIMYKLLPATVRGAGMKCAV